MTPNHFLFSIFKFKLALIGFVISALSPQSPVLSLLDKITYDDFTKQKIGFVCQKRCSPIDRIFKL